MCYCPHLTHEEIREVKQFPQSHTARKKDIQELNAFLFDFLTKVLIYIRERVRTEEMRRPGVGGAPGVQATRWRTSLSGCFPDEPLSLNQDVL